MKPVIIIGIAFVLLVPSIVFAENHIDFSTDKTLYYLEDIVQISGIVDYQPEKNNVLVELFNPENNLEDWNNISVNPDGMFSTSFHVGSSVFPYDGAYTIKVTYGGSVEKIITYSSIAPFVDESKDPQSYVDRYNNEPQYKKWFDDNYPEYVSIYEAVGLKSPTTEMSEAEKQAREEIPNPCINIREPKVATEYQGDIGLNNPVYMEAVREAQYQYQQQIQHCFREYQMQIDQRIAELEEPEIVCGTGTIEKNGQCVPERATMTTEMQQKSSNGGGCLIATATYDSELAPQVQMLREIRDNSLLQTESGSAFMESFNSFYYSFSPAIADYERQNPVFKEAVKITITPLVASLSLLNCVDLDSEESVLGYGISLILLNFGMYFVAPAIVVHRVRKFVNSENS